MKINPGPAQNSAAGQFEQTYPYHTPTAFSTNPLRGNALFNFYGLGSYRNRKGRINSGLKLRYIPRKRKQGSHLLTFLKGFQNRIPWILPEKREEYIHF